MITQISQIHAKNNLCCLFGKISDFSGMNLISWKEPKSGKPAKSNSSKNLSPYKAEVCRYLVHLLTSFSSGYFLMPVIIV